jgi:eukaryotic-like serine/threonine-protein kinase
MLPDQSPDARGAAGARLLNSRYEVGEKIGEGSFFAVYRGRDTQSGRAVAIKIVSDEHAGDREFAERLQAEALAAARLDHPHIVAVYDAWVEGGRVAIASEFVRGIDLKERVRRVAPFPLAVAIDIAAAVSEALEYAASQGLSHGDLRPENILVTPEGQVKLADFGVGAAVCASSRLQMSALLHSAHYLPPEVAQGKAPSAPSDVYAVGAILFEMLSGQPPFQADTPFAIAVKHLHEPPPSLRRQNAGVPKAVEGIVLKCLQKDPAARYPNPAALLADLRGVREALRFGKPLTWSPVPEPVPPAAGRGAEAAPRTAPPAPVPTPVPPRRPPAERASGGFLGEPSTRILVVLPLMALVLAGAVFAMFVLGTRAPRDTTVPNVLGMTGDEAKRHLADLGLGMHIARESFDEKAAPGTVTATDPPPDQQVKQGRAVDVWISKGPKPAIVPNLLGLTETEARARISEAKLSVGEVRHEFDEIVPIGQIISQEPAAQTQVERRSGSVSFVVSKGPEPEPPPEPTTAPEPVPSPSPEGTSTDNGAAVGGSTDSPPGGGTSTGTGTMTDPSSSGGSLNQPAPDAVIDKNRTFDISTKMEGDKPMDRLRIVVTDDRPRHQVVSALYPRGETVHKSIKATGAPGTVRIEVYVNQQLVKDEQH